MSRDNRESKRRSFFGALSGLQSTKDESEPTNVLRKRRAASFMTTFSAASQQEDREPLDTPGANSPVSPATATVTVTDPANVTAAASAVPAATPRPPLSSRSATRPNSIFGSLRGLRLPDENDEPLSATSTRSHSDTWSSVDEAFRKGQVLQHGEVQTSSSMFRKKKEYLVLTETHLMRFKSHNKAAEAFSRSALYMGHEAWYADPHSISSPYNRLSTYSTYSNYRHSQSPSTGSHEFQSIASDASGDRGLGIPLRQIVAVYQLEDGRPHFAIEVFYLDDESNNASSMTLQFGDPDDMTRWLANLREAANRIRLADSNPLSAYNSHLAARVVEAERDYVPPHYAIYKVVQRPMGKTSARSSSDDLSKMLASVCFLAIGVHKVHLIPLFKPPAQRSSSPSLVSHSTQSSYGILSITELRVSEADDTFELTFRLPLQRPKTIHLASLASHDIAVRLRYVEENLRPEWESRPYHFLVPDDVKRDILRQASPHPIDGDSLDRTLTGYCIAYDIKPETIRYEITYPEDDYPRFELLRPLGLRRTQYTVLELLAIMRSLRYNESFGGISFKDVQLDILNGLVDDFGTEHVCTKTKRGTHVRMDVDELGRSCLLVQEIRALAITSRKLRRLDFSSCITRKPKDPMDSVNRTRDMGCGIVEALFPLCKHQTTNVDWIALNNITLGDTDLDYLVAAAVERSCHLRALELSGCGLTDRSLYLILDALRPQENTLEALDLSSNPFRLSPTTFDSQIGVFGYLTKLNLSHVSRTSGPEPLISVETFHAWRLQELILSGTSLNTPMVDAIASYLVDYKQSKSLRLLKLDHCYLNGKDIAYLLHSMTETPGQARELHLDVSENYIEHYLDKLTGAIANGLAPSGLTIRLLEFEKESDFRKMVLALAANNTIRHLDISQASLPSEASEATCQALEKMFAENTSLEWLDISGEDSRLETTKLGVGINRALRGLQRNKTLRALIIRYQKLGLQGASTLADVLKVNTTLQYLYCENNGITLGGFTDLVNALHRNTTLLYLPSMQESRQLALKQTEDQVKQMRGDKMPYAYSRPASVRSKIASKVTGKPSKERTPSAGLSDQDIKHALGLVDESWQRQEYRLEQYLQRNTDIHNGIPTALDVNDEEFERPDTGSSLNRVLEKVIIDSTPTAEKDIQLGSMIQDGILPHPTQHHEVTTLEKEIEMSFSENSEFWGNSRFPG